MKTAACRACDCVAAGQPLSQSRACADARHARARRALLQRVQARTCSAGPCQAAHGCRAQTPRCATGHGAPRPLLLHCGSPIWARACGHVGTPAAPMALPNKLYALPLTQGTPGRLPLHPQTGRLQALPGEGPAALEIECCAGLFELPDLDSCALSCPHTGLCTCATFCPCPFPRRRAAPVGPAACYSLPTQVRSSSAHGAQLSGTQAAASALYRCIMSATHAHSAPRLHTRLLSCMCWPSAEVLRHRSQGLLVVGQGPSACQGPC